MKDKTKVIGRPLTKAEWAQLLAPQVKKHIAIEVNKVARRWHLGTADAKELGSHVVAELAMKVARNYDAMRQNMYSFVQMALPGVLKDWQDEAYQRKTTIVPVGDMLELAEKAQTEEAAATGLEREVLNALNLLATEGREDSSIWQSDPFEIVAREDDCRYTQCVIAKLSPLNQEICRTYIETLSLQEVRRHLKISEMKFFKRIWPACQEAFKKNWGNEEKVGSATPSQSK